MKRITSYRIARFPCPFINVKTIVSAMICLVACFVSTHPTAAQEFQSTSLVHPDGAFSPNALNSLAQIAGTVTINDTTYHAVRREQDGQYTNLTEFGGNLSQAFCINDKGDVAGITIDENGYGHTVVWENGEIRELSVPLNAAVSPIPVDLNDSGLVTGYYWDGGGINYALVWDTNGAFQFLSMDGGVQNYPSAINDAGAVVGTVQLANGTTRAYIWQPDTSLKSGLATGALAYMTRDIGTLGGHNAQALDINNSGRVVGFSNYDTSNQFIHAFVWQDSIMVDLGTLGGDNSIANTINNEGIVMGRSQLADSAATKSSKTDPLNWAGGIDFNALKDGRIGNPLPLKTTVDVQINEDDVFYIKTSRWFLSYAMNNPEDPEHGGLGTDLDDGWSLNSDKGFLGLDIETGYKFIWSNHVYLDPYATGGSAGFHWDPYPSLMAALADNSELTLRRFNWLHGVYEGNINLKAGAKYTFGTFRGQGHMFQKNPLDVTVVLDGDLIVPMDASLTFRGGMDNTFIICEQSNIGGDVKSSRGTNLFFRENVMTGLNANLRFSDRKNSVSLTQFDHEIMGEGSMSFSGPGSQQLNTYGDVGIPTTIDKKDGGQLVINSNDHSFSDVNLMSGDVVPLYGFSMNENAKLDLGRGWFRSLFGGTFVFNNPDPDGITGAVDSAWLRMAIQRYISRAGPYLFPAGVFSHPSPITVKTDFDAETKLSLTVEYLQEDDLDEPPEIPEGFKVFVPKLGKNVFLDGLFNFWYKLNKDGEFTEDPAIWMELHGMENVKTAFCLHPVQVDLQTRILELAGKDPGLVETSLLDGAPMVCQPEVEIKDSMLLGIATNLFLNPINQPPTQVFARARIINLTYDQTQMDTYVNNSNIHFPIGFKEGTPFGAIAEGLRKVEAVHASEQDNSNPVLEESINFSDGNNYTIVAAGMGTDLEFFVDSNASMNAADSSSVEIKIFHGHPNLGSLSVTPVIDGNSASYTLQLEYGEFSQTKSEFPALFKIPLFGSFSEYDLSDRAGESLLLLVTPRIVNDGQDLKSSSEEEFDLVLMDALGREIIPVLTSAESVKGPKGYSLQANFPNPFDQSTSISYSIPEPLTVRMMITNMAGQQVRKLVNSRQQPGYHTIEWDGRDDIGKAMPAGMYLYRLEAGDFSQTRTMMLLR